MGRTDDNTGRATASRQPLVSIITVVLNGAGTLDQAIKSVVKQGFKDFEYIIVDGGSADGSIEIIKKYDSQLTCWTSEPDKGIYDAMNKGVALSKGKWVYFLGSDDQLLDGFATAANCLKDAKTLYYGNVYRPVIDRIYDGQFSAYKLACRNICHQSIFYPRAVWARYSYNLKYPVFADYDLNLRCFADDHINFEYIPVTIAVFSDAGGISRTQADSAFEKDKFTLIKEGFPFWIYMLILVRSFLLKMLAAVRLQRVATAIYHSLLKARSDHAKGEPAGKRRDEEG